jgi:hypothetical protein
LVKSLFDRGLNAEEIRQLFRFIRLKRAPASRYDVTSM